MERKTNLFYTNGNDSNFLTFSNFTEALTGNFLSTDWKIYPSRFLCLYIPALEGDNKEELRSNFIINHLVAYYENKLAFLRDYYDKQTNKQENETSDNVEEKINPLAFLMHTIYNYDSTYEVTFIGEVTEFDYKGSYTDTICVIDASDGTKTYNKNSTNGSETIPYNVDNQNILYGWISSELNGTNYSGISPILDGNGYTVGSTYNIEASGNGNGTIRFNVIIPLFDITNINYNTNFNENDESVEPINNDTGYDDKENHSQNNPMGIWFADEPIELKRDTKYAPSWSLTISSQFKPLPYSNDYLKNDITSEDNQQAFATYAKILSKQSDLSNELYNLSSKISKIEQTLTRLTNLVTDERIQQILKLDKLSNTLQETLNKLNYSEIVNKVIEELNNE